MPEDPFIDLTDLCILLTYVSQAARHNKKKTTTLFGIMSRCRSRIAHAVEAFTFL
jgi:hypothetical protein